MASLVLVSHSYLFTSGSPAGEPLTAWTGRSLGEHAVQVFFFLSGLMVAQSLDRSHTLLDFCAARALRIFPALIVCVLLTALALGPALTILPLGHYLTSGELFAYIAKTATLATGSAPLPGVFETLPYANHVNSSLWTLKYEVICYAILAFCGALGLVRSKEKGAAALTVALVVLSYAKNPPADQDAYGLIDTIRYFLLFFFPGVLAYLVREQLALRASFLIPLAVIAYVCRDTALDNLSLAICLGYGALVLAIFAFGPLRKFCNRFDLSFGIYIFHAPVEQALIETYPGVTPLVLSALTFAIVVPAALLSWLIIERPALQLRPSFREFAWTYLGGRGRSEPKVSLVERISRGGLFTKSF